MTRRRQLSLLAAAAVVVIVAAALVVVLGNRPDAPSGGIAKDQRVTIDSAGTPLSAEVITPRNSAKPPLVVMPASWGQPATEYREIGRHLADDGYLVVAYAQRGFGGSGGEVDFAGADTQADVGRVIDWALRTTGADKQRVGLYGMSYGAGVSLLAAAKDPRVKAVAALSTWTDLGTSYDPDDTPSTRALATLLGSGQGRREDGTVRSLRTLIAKNPVAVGARMRQLSPSRSPMTYVDDLNRNKTAVMLGNAYEDSLFGPGQLVSFYDRLTTPKRLQLEAGDHGSPEAPALRGDGTRVTNAAQAWLDHYLRGTDNGIDREAPIVLYDAKTGVAHTRRSWPTAAGKDAIALGRPGSKQQTGAGHATAWSSQIVAGADTVATSGPPVSPFGSYTPPNAKLLTIVKELAFFWTGPAATEPTAIGGTPRVRIRLASDKPAMTVVAYLYDIDDTGTGELMSVQPYSATDLKQNSAKEVTIDMQPIAWTLAPGHRLVLVIDTQDPRYTSRNPYGARITASATAGQPATVSVPAL